MQRKQVSRILGTLALSATLAVPAGAFAQKSNLSDAQVEANVLKAFAADAKLANQPIQTSTAFGIVTLSGSVSDEAARTAAEQIASRTEGVKKVVDQLTVGAQQNNSANPNDPNYDPAAQNMLPGDGQVEAGQAALNEQGNQGPANGNMPPNQQPYGQPGYPQNGQGDYAQNGRPGYPQGQPGYPQGQPGYPQGQPGYPQGQSGYPQSRPGYPQNQPANAQGQPGYAQGQPGYPQNDERGYPQGQPGYGQGNQPDYAQGGQPGYDPSAGQQPNGAPPATGPDGHPRLYYRDYQRQMAQGYGQGYQQQGPAQGQPGGQVVTVPPNAVLAVRINRWLNSERAEPGSAFTGMVAQDVVAGGQIAIPRGATVNGTVVDAKGAGVLKGRGELTLQLNTLELGGQMIPLQTAPFTITGHDKTGQTVASTILGAGMGALIGGGIGRGAGAAVGAGVGGAAGLGASAASNGGQAIVPAEGLIHFQTSAPVQVVTVSQAELQRLAMIAGPVAPPRRPYPPRPYYPGYYYRY